MLKTPQNLTVPLRTYRKRLIKELITLGVLQKPHTFLRSIENMVCLELQREGTSYFFTSGSKVRDYHIFKTGEDTLWSKTC